MINQSGHDRILYEHIYRTASVGIAIIEPQQGEWLSVNPALCTLLGYEEEELKQAGDAKLYAEQDAASSPYITIAEEMLRTPREQYSLQRHLRHGQGHIVRTSIDVSVVRDEQGEPIYYIAQFQQSEPLEPSVIAEADQEIYRMITENARDLVSYSNAEGILQYVSESFYSVLGYTPEEMIGQSRMLYYHPDDAKNMMNSGQAYLDQGMITRRLKHKQGHYLWFEISFQTVRDMHGQISKVLGIGRNVNDRIKYEDSLREVQRIAQIGSWDWDIASGILTSSKEAQELFPYMFQHPESSVEHICKLIHPVDLESMIETVKSSFRNEKTGKHIFRILLPDGTTRYLQSHWKVSTDGTDQPLQIIGMTQDITSRIEMEERLKESERQHRLISEQSLDFISRLSVEESIYLYCSPACSTILGYHPDELEGTSVLNYIHPDDLEAIRQYMNLNTLDEQQSKPVSYRHRHRSGGYVWLEASGRFIESDESKASQILLIARDIQERRHSAQLIQESEQRYRSLFDYNPASVFSFDIQGRYTTINAEMEKLVGRTEDELIGRSFECFVAPENVYDTVEHFERALQGEPQSYESRVVVKNGDTREVSVVNLPIVVDEQIVGVYGIATDITEMKRHMEQIEKLSNEYTLILNSVSEGIFGLDTEGHTTFINPAATRMLGFSTFELVGQPLLEMFQLTHADGSAYLPQDHPIDRALREGSSYEEQEAVFLRKDGSSFMVSYRITPIWDRGKRKGAVVVFNDITNEKQIIRAKEIAERADRAKSEFLAIMSHEIRTPMNGIIGMTGLLADTDMDEEQRSYIEIIRDSSDALLHILNEILDFSRIEAGKMLLEHTPIQVHPLLDGVLDLFTSRAAEKGIELTCHTSDKVPQAIIGDASRLRQVLVNLISNAIKFTDNGSVTVSVREMERRANECVLEFEVSDTGIGISSDKQSLLFQSFSQLHPSINRKYGGTGLGLAICKKLIELMGGTISVDSEEGRGATFRFVLPVHYLPDDYTPEYRPSQRVEEASAEDVMDGKYGPLRILIAEDHPVNQKLIHEMIRKLGYRSDIANNGQEAVNMALTRPYELIFMDIQMPELDGIEATREIRERLPEHEQPIIVATTAFARSSDRDMCLEAGMQDFISKPLRLQEVERVLRECALHLHPLD